MGAAEPLHAAEVIKKLAVIAGTFSACCFWLLGNIDVEPFMCV